MTTNRAVLASAFATTLACTVAFTATFLGLRRDASAEVLTFPEAPPAGAATFANIRGGVRAMLVHGDTIYVGGSFRVTQAGVTRTNLAAFDLGGNLKPAFAASPNGTVLALATDGTSLFVGGEFTRLDLKKRLAAVDLVTGKVNRRFTAHVTGRLDPDAGPSVRTLALMADPSTQPPTVRLVVGGNFTAVNDTSNNRSGLAALRPDSGDLDDAAFAQGVEGGFVDTLLATGDALYVGGSFTTVQGRAASLMALGATGMLLPGRFGGGGQHIVDLDIDEATNRLFAAVGGGGNRVQAFVASGPDQGRQLWRGPRTGGDVQAVHHYAGNVYFGFHDGLFVEPDAYKLAVVDAATGLLAVDADHQGLTCADTDEERVNCWLPELDNTAGGQGFFGVWAIKHVIDPVTAKAGLVVGGDFTQIGGVAGTRRLAIFREP